MEQKGILIRAVSSFYDVSAGETVLRCRARGRLRLDGLAPTPGDLVRFKPDPEHAGFGILTGIEPRKNYFIRPNVANLDQILFVASAARPATDPFLIDRMSVAAAHAGCRFILCLNKTDSHPGDEIQEIYHQSGIPVIRTSAVTGEGIPDILASLQGRLSVLTGNSGVGKTSLLNRILPGLDRKTGEISEKHGRGKHTTRQTELFSVGPNSWIADTPGFASLDVQILTALKPEDLASCFPEFPTDGCRFPDCRHISEPDCSVRESVLAGKIQESRYQSYLRIIKEL